MLHVNDTFRAEGSLYTVFIDVYYNNAPNTAAAAAVPRPTYLPACMHFRRYDGLAPKRSGCFTFVATVRIVACTQETNCVTTVDK